MRTSALADRVFDLSEYTKTSECGSGAFSSVYLYTHKRTREVVAVKRLSHEVDSPVTQTMFFREITILLSIGHPCILPFRGFNLPSAAHSRFEIITEFMPNGNVQDHENAAARGGAPPEWNATCKSKVIYGTACGMAFVHRTHIIHRDLKAENVFLNQDWDPFIADFGLSKDIGAEKVLQMSAVMGTPYYMAPELFGDDGRNASYPIDVYAWGVIVLSLFTNGAFQFPNARITGLPLLVAMLHRGERFLIPQSVPEWLRELITSCWEAKPEMRPGFDDIVATLDQQEDWLPGTNMDVFREYKERITNWEGSAPVVDEEGGEPSHRFNFS
jgi:serine/threonine protein kinase